MEHEKILGGYSEKIICEIPFRLPSLNDYIRECRANKYKGAKMKAEIESDIACFVKTLPHFNHPVRIHFVWVEENRRRDLDNIAFAKKFILDVLVKCGRLKNDNRNHVVSFTDSFKYGDKSKVILEIEEVIDEGKKNNRIQGG